MNLPENYIPILIQASLAIGFVIIVVISSGLLGPKAKGGNVKTQAFESGYISSGDARTPFSVKYFLTAILFVLFDIEIVFFYPYAVNFKEFGVEGFLAIVTFVVIFFVAFLYVWKRGALDWDK